MTNTVPRPPFFNTLGEMDARYWLKNDPLAMGPEGPQGPEGPIGPEGPRGDDGQAVKVRWTVATALNLPASNVNIGDGALVGTAPNFLLYVYVNDPPQWVNAGPVSAGPQGPPGPQGPQGPAAPLAGTGVANTAARSDHHHNGIYAAAIHSHSATSIVTGTLDLARLPGLPASQITTGTIPDARIGSVDASKITGVLDAARIPGLDASAITAGTIPLQRLPALPASQITSGTLSDSVIPGLNASKITTGTFPAARIPALNASKVTAGVFGKDRIPNKTLPEMFPNNDTSNSFSASSMRVGPGNQHAALGILGSGWGLHDTGMRQNTDEAWAYVFIPNIGFCWIPANRI